MNAWSLFRSGRALGLALVGLSVAWVTGCESAGGGSAGAPGVVHGVVVDPIHERPVPGVRVSAHDMGEATTDAEGRFSLTLPAGTHTLWFAGDDILSGTRERVHVRAGKEVTVEADVFPRVPSETAIHAYFARRGPRHHDHPAYVDPDAARTPPADAVPPSASPGTGDGGDEHTDPGTVGGAVAPLVQLPAVIRVWRSSQSGALAPSAGNGWADNSCNPAVTVETIPLEEYVGGVVTHEWIPSWHEEALRAGAIATRTYAVRWAERGGRWDCADVDDGTVTQVYRDTHTVAGDAAVQATLGLVVTRDGAIITTEFSAENTDPTAFGVDDPTCTGTTRFGHGRGMCQWGTQRWANGTCANAPCDFGAFGAEPKQHVWMVEHYYPGATVEDGYIEPVEPCAVIPAAGGQLDEEGPCFTAFGNPIYWREEAAGESGHLYWTNAFQSDAPGNWAQWRLHFEAPGEYEVEVYIDDTFGVYEAARYVVEHADGEDEVLIDQGTSSGWVSLGVYSFDDAGSVRLLDNVVGSVPGNQHIVADALRVRPIVSPMQDAGVLGDQGGLVGDAGGGEDAGPGRRPKSGCGCHVSADSASPWPYGLGWLSLGVVVRARRRRHRRVSGRRQ
ncbi:MAG: SpoIID/LytB domain-containing protein [Polyangiales bacterium]